MNNGWALRDIRKAKGNDKTLFRLFMFDLLLWNMVNIMLYYRFNSTMQKTIESKPSGENIVVDSAAWQSKYLNFFPYV